MILFYSNKPTKKLDIAGYTHISDVYDPHKICSQKGYVFTYNNTVISCRFIKQNFVATFSNHSDILALHESDRECIWLRSSLIYHIQSICKLTFVTNIPIVIFEENVACMAQVRGGYIKGDRALYTLELQHGKKMMSNRYALPIIYGSLY